MRQKFGKLSLLFPIGLFIMAATTIVSRFIEIDDFIAAIAYSAGVGLVLLPFIIKPSKPIALAE
jgi:hypothetical protein